MEYRRAAANPALRELTFPVQTRGAAVRAEGDGELAAVDQAGRRAFHSPKALMWDSSGPEGDDLRERVAGPGQSRVRAAMPTSVQAGAVSVVPDAAVLDRPETRYPVFVDPSWRVDNPLPNAVAWTHVDSYWAGQDYSTHWDTSNATSMPVGPYQDPVQGYTGVSRSLIVFNSAWMAGKTINVARLQTTLTSSYYCGGTTREVQAWSSGWAGGATTWNSQPAIRTHQSSRWTARPCSGSTGVDFDVTAAAREVAAARGATLGLALRAPASAESSRDTTFRHKYANNASLYVEYNTRPNDPKDHTTDHQPCSTAAAPAYVANRRPTLRNTVSDPDGGVVTTWYTVLRWDAAKSDWVVVDGTVVAQADIPSGAVSQLTPAADLPDGRYYWRSQSHDGIEPSAVVGNCEFVVDGTAPPAPKAVTSTDYPSDNTEHGVVGRTGSFMITPPDGGRDDVAAYVVTVNDNQPAKGRVFPVTTAGQTVVVQATPTQPATNTLYVWSRDRAGNLSDPAKPLVYTFKAGQPTADVAHWTMNEAGGTATTDRLGGRVATLSGGATLAGGVLTTDGTNGYAAAPGPVVASDESFTVAAWVRLPEIPARWSVAVAQSGDHVNAYQLSYTSAAGRWRFGTHETDAVSPVGAAVTSAEAPKAATWTHLTGVYDSGARQIRLYVNGTLAGTAAAGGVFRAAGPVMIGRTQWKDGWVDYWPGDLDDVRIWDRAVAASELGSIVSAGDGLALRWDLDEGTGTTVADSSGRGNPGTLTGNSSWTVGNDGSDPDDGAVHMNRAGTIDAPGAVVRTDRSYTVAAWVRLDTEDKINKAVVSADGTQSVAFWLGYPECGSVRRASARW